MKAVVYLLFHLLTTLAKLIRPGGSRTVIAENLILRQQLIIHSRIRQRAPNLTTHDRTLLGFLSLFSNPRRIARTAIIKPSTLLDFHNALKQRKYRLLYSPRGRKKPGPKGPAKDRLWSADLFRCESILLKSHWVMVVMDQYTRRIIGFGVNAGDVDGPTLCRMFNDATSRQTWITSFETIRLITMSTGAIQTEMA